MRVIRIESMGAYNFGNYIISDGVSAFGSMAGASAASIDITFSVWFNLDSFEPLRPFFGEFNEANNVNGILSDSGVRFRSGSDVLDFTLPTLSVSTWYHLMFAYDATAEEGRVWLNGTESSTGAVSGVWDMDTVDQAFRYNTGARMWEGGIDDMCWLEGYVGDGTDAAAIYNGGAGANPESVLGTLNRWYKFNESDGATTAVDSGSDGSDMTLNNYSTPPAYYVAH